MERPYQVESASCQHGPCKYVVAPDGFTVAVFGETMADDQAANEMAERLNMYNAALMHPPCRHSDKQNVCIFYPNEAGCRVHGPTCRQPRP